MSDFDGVCPHCLQRFSAPGEVFGTEVECPSCKRKFFAFGIPCEPPLPKAKPSPKEPSARSLKKQKLKALRSETHYPLARALAAIFATLFFLSGLGVFFEGLDRTGGGVFVGIGGFLFFSGVVVYGIGNVIFDIADALLDGKS